MTYDEYKDQNIDFPLRCDKAYLERYNIDKAEHFQRVLKIAKNHFSELKAVWNIAGAYFTDIKIRDDIDFNINQLSEFFENLDYAKDLK